MKINISRKAMVILIAISMTFLMVQGAMAAAYFEAGAASQDGTPTSLVLTYYGGSKAMYFTNQPITSPTGDNIVGRYQAIGGLYSMSRVGSTNVYTLTYNAAGSAYFDVGTQTVKAQSASGSTVYFDALATALQINFDSNTIAWSNVTLASSINNSIGSTALDDLAASSTYAFTSFTFEQLASEGTWLSGTSGSLNARYYSKLEGFSAAPEPAEWILMFIGLGLLGFFLKRRGYLSFDFSPQAAA